MSDPIERLKIAGNYMMSALEVWTEISHCECDNCPNCGKTPKECSETECSLTCQCSECDHCHGEAALAAWHACLASARVAEAVDDLETERLVAEGMAVVERVKANLDARDAPRLRRRVAALELVVDGLVARLSNLRGTALIVLDALADWRVTIPETRLRADVEAAKAELDYARAALAAATRDGGA